MSFQKSGTLSYAIVLGMFTCLILTQVLLGVIEFHAIIMVIEFHAFIIAFYERYSSM